MLGDSICVNGVCLTVVDLGRTDFSADVAVETLKVTNLGDLKTGGKIRIPRRHAQLLPHPADVEPAGLREVR